MEDGTTVQSLHNINEHDTDHERRATAPVLGVILNVYLSDNRLNRSAAPSPSQRGSRCECEVMVVNDGLDNTWFIPNAVLLQHGATGIDNFHEEIPRASTAITDGSQYRGNMANIDFEKLDGDWCIVQFLGGDINQPIITHWFPHPGNISDSATGGFADQTLVQAPRLFKRFAGTKLTITPQGSVYLDTNESNSILDFGSGNLTRLADARGGDVYINVKNDSTFEINLNPVVPTPIEEPSLPQKNPPAGEFLRAEIASKLTMDKNFITAIAGETARIIARTSNIEITPAGNLYLGSNTATENFIMGQSWKTMMETLIDALLAATYPTGTGPSGTMNTPSSTTLTNLKNALDDQLSKFIFGQENSPTP